MVQREPRSAPPEMTLGSTPGRGILRGRFQGISLETDRICPEPLQTASPRPSGQPSGQPSGSSRHSCREALRTAVRKVSAQLSGSPPEKVSGTAVWDSSQTAVWDSSQTAVWDSYLGSSQTALWDSSQTAVWLERFKRRFKGKPRVFP